MKKNIQIVSELIDIYLQPCNNIPNFNKIPYIIRRETTITNKKNDYRKLPTKKWL